MNYPVLLTESVKVKIVMTTELQTDQNAEMNVTAEMWAELNFQGKEFCTLNGNQELVLSATPHSEERVLAVLNVENYITVINALCEKFKEVTSKVNEVETEWAQTTEKLKLNGKVSRTKDYVARANAIGDYAPLLQNLHAKEEEIKAVLNHNLAEKMKLVDKAEALKESEEWKQTTEEFKTIINNWKTAHPLDKSKNEQLWERIEQARSHFYERKRKHQEGIEQDMMQNLDLKLELCELAEKCALSEDWKKTSDLLKELMDKWKTVGHVASVDKNEELWNRFIGARNTFFDRKKQHFEQINVEQEANYALKIALVEKAESLTESTDWKETTAIHNQIMDEWKSIGRVPFEKSEEIWSRLQVARDKFFTAKRQNAEEHRVNLEDNYAQKQAILNRAEALKNSENWRETTDEMNELLTEWKKIGYIPREYGDTIWEAFIAARQHFFNRKDADREKRKTRFQNQLNTRYQQTKQFLDKIVEELTDEENKLVEFNESLSNTEENGNAKDMELRKHLQNLIQQIERKLPARKNKIEEVKQQLAELEQRKAEQEKKKAEDKKQVEQKPTESNGIDMGSNGVADPENSATESTEENNEQESNEQEA